MRVLMVTSGGGHLAHLWALRPWWQELERRWVVVDTPDARARLEGEEVTWIAGPVRRTPQSVVPLFARFPSIFREFRPDRVVTAGAAVGVPAVFWAAGMGIRSHFIEVVDRVGTPSLSARLCRPVAHIGVHWDCQVAGLPGACVLGPLWGAPAEPRPHHETGEGVFVTVGTPHQPFDRLVSAAEALADRGHRVVVQRGASKVQPRGCEVHDWMVPEVWQAHVRSCAVTVTHAGPASIQAVVREGGTPIVVPRHPLWREHIDGHQQAFAEEIRDRVHVVLDPRRLVDAVETHHSRCAALPASWDPAGESDFVARVADWVAG